MSKSERTIIPRVNFFDGQNITQADLETEQLRQNASVSNLSIDFHGSGVIVDSPFDLKVLLDTRNPGKWADDSTNPSEADIQAGEYDGKAIYLDRQPSDVDRGNRLVIELVNSAVAGRDKTKIMILGKAFDGLGTPGKLVCEFIEFGKNERKLTKYYYTEVISIFFNNFSGGNGKTYYESDIDSKDLISDSEGYLTISEAQPLSVFAQTEHSYQTESPNFDFNSFITSSTSLTLEDEIEAALGSENSITDIYIEKDGKDDCVFEKDGSTTIAYGQKFLAKTNNIQSIDLYLKVDEDISTQFDFSGNLVLGVYELTTDAVCSTDAIPENLIDFDPEISPILEISMNQAQLEAIGYKLSDSYKKVSFSFSNTLIANPNINPSLTPGKYYSFIISRRGDNQTGTVRLAKGYDKAFKKQEDGVELFARERFGKQESKFFEYDPSTKRYVNDSDSSLWYCVHSDSVEVVDGHAYLYNGRRISLPKTESYVGGSEISRYYNNISLKEVAYDEDNYVVLSYRERFASPVTHPMSGNFVASRVYEEGEVSVLNTSELEEITSDYAPLILALVKDTNTRTDVSIAGVIDKPGQIDVNKITIFNPGSNLLDRNLIGRVFVPDTDCECSFKYRIVKAECKKIYAGDLNSDKKLTATDLSLMLDVAGNTITSDATQRKILGGELNIIDFVKSDLNNDQTIDGFDIELLEDAIDGYVNFSIPESFNILELTVENIFEEDDFPSIFEDAASTGITTALSNEITFSTISYQEALAIRIGDKVQIPSPSLDEGEYLIAEKQVANDNVTITIVVTDLFGGAVSFNGDSAFNVLVTSGTATNITANNKSLLDIPFASKNYAINFTSNSHHSYFINTCDLRRFVESTFIEEVTTSCVCETDDCSTPAVCSPQYKNQLYLPGDLYLPNGNILSSPGVPHPGDFEYVNISVPLPPGTIENCSIDLYNTFIRADEGGCKTAAGYDAMKYSDGTYVGCEDSGLDTDITKGRVKFSQSIASLHVDAFVDGYVVDEVESHEESVLTSEHIFDQYDRLYYNDFDDWGVTSDVEFTITNNVSESLSIDLTTTTSVSEKTAEITSPLAAQGLGGNFIIDINAHRLSWSGDLLTTGTVSFYYKLEVSNTDGSFSELNIGWRVSGGEDTKLFFSGKIYNTLMVEIESFDYEIDSPEDVGDKVIFRLKRESDIITAWYVLPSAILESTIDSFGQFVRIGSNTINPQGSGDVELFVIASQEDSTDAGLVFETLTNNVDFRSSFLSSIVDVSSPTTSIISGNITTAESSSMTLLLPLPFSGKTDILSATLKLIPATSGTISENFEVVPFETINASSFSSFHNYPVSNNNSIIETFSPGTFISGEAIDVDVTNMVTYWVSQIGHLPGYGKGIYIRKQYGDTASLEISTQCEIVYEYRDVTSGVIFKVGVTIDPSTGIASFNTKNILYDYAVAQNRTVINFGVYLKKSGFKNKDIALGINELKKIGLGECFDQNAFSPEDQCYFVVGTSGTGVFIDGPFDCLFQS